MNKQKRGRVSMVSMRGYMGVLLFLTAAMSFATGVPWKVAADGDFSTGMNWLGDAVPDANQTVVFTNKAASAYKVTLSENVTNESFSMGTDRVVLDLNGNNLPRWTCFNDGGKYWFFYDKRNAFTLRISTNN